MTLNARHVVTRSSQTLAAFRLAAAAGLLVLAGLIPAQATIRTPANATGLGSELFLLVYAAAGPFTYTLDLGLFMDDFFSTAQPDAGYQRFWAIDPTDDAAWRRLMSLSANAANFQWTVLASDAAGNTLPGGLRLFTTVAQGNEGRLAGFTNQTLESLIKSTTLANLITQTNNIGTPDLGGNENAGDQVARHLSTLFDNSDGQSPQADATLLFPSFNSGTGAMGTPLNTVGNSSWFYYLTRSSTSNLASNRVRVDEFDNLGADGYWGFIKEDQPGSERYLLSYTLPAYVSPTEQAANVVFGNNFARMAGILSLSSAAGKGDSVLSLTEGFLRGMTRGANAGARVQPQSVDLPANAFAVSSVPEPQTWGLMLGGLALLGAARRRARG